MMGIYHPLPTPGPRQQALIADKILTTFLNTCSDGVIFQRTLPALLLNPHSGRLTSTHPTHVRRGPPFEMSPLVTGLLAFVLTTQNTVQSPNNND